MFDNGVAAVDKKHQVVVAAEAFSQGPENNLLEPMLEQTKSSGLKLLASDTIITADAGFNIKESLDYCETQQLDAYVADIHFRKRDPRFAERERFKPKRKAAKSPWFTLEDFDYDAEKDQCICPAGKQMWKQVAYEGTDREIIAFVGYLHDCRSCPLQKQCMKKPPTLKGRFLQIKRDYHPERDITQQTRMKRKIDSKQGRHIYSQRLGTVEPVFGNINTTKGLRRFSLRGKTKVNAQWLMYCMVHNIEKIQRYGHAA